MLLEKLYTKNIGLLITIGNIIPSLYPEEFIDKFPDLIFSYGEGEKTFLDFTKHIQCLMMIEDIDVIIYKDKKSSDYKRNDKTAIDMNYPCRY